MDEPRFVYPMMLNLAGRKALVVGGGNVALRKAQALVEAGALVRCVATEFLPEFQADGRLVCLTSPYHAKHVFGMAIVVAATDNEAVNRRAAHDARTAGAMVNVVDTPSLCDFIVPATVDRGRLVIAVSTGGAAPSLARRIRERLEREFGPEYSTYLDVMEDVRRDLQARNLSPDVRRQVFERLSEDDMIAAAREGPDAARRAMAAAVAQVLGGAGT
jgi:precorrin-2 dehydrogenase/sirohydrochlorin ferrochelatase